MEQPQDAPALATAFPAPPPFWQSFTKENLERLKELRAVQTPPSKDYDAAKELPLRILDLPPELRLLQPPDQPADGKYRLYGDIYDLKTPLGSLQEQNVEQLYTPPGSPSGGSKAENFDRAFILKKLAKSLLLNFLELVGIMAVNPGQDPNAPPPPDGQERHLHAYEEKIGDLQTIFLNFHHLLNEYRPHQARESLILMMQDQLEKSKAETQGIREMKEKVEGILEGLSQAKLAEAVEMNGKGDQDDLDGQDVWAELEKEFD
ncbi:related to MED7-member of RNA Polymerase II transcriptional regulation mediator complex [Phialocephala subalpina]|uniref:Mediator of RNA polymerase II transcription subunit 7 n=1 Tax=Phialocephala subalpina TaxID=576137 RepID=A0A1L7X4H9_9HELO|nr:related to MED7-member of RNA Polymerase II transcriptional regulation mediator complex [Phialocephala subalpina]